MSRPDPLDGGKLAWLSWAGCLGPTEIFGRHKGQFLESLASGGQYLDSKSEEKFR